MRGNTLTWNAVEGATSYTVRINGTEYAADTNSFDLSQYESAGELSVMVRADGANNSLWSDAKPLRYLAMSGALVYAANTVTYFFGHYFRESKILHPYLHSCVL